MIKENIKISADGFDLKYIRELANNPLITRVHIGCIENNYDAIKKSIGIENAVVHILINRIDSIEKLKNKLKEYNVKRVLLINGNPHPKPYKHDFIEIIKQLKPIVEVYVAAYPTSYFFIQTKHHLNKQVDILKEKIDAGAKEVYLQSTYSIKKLSKFHLVLKENNLNIPLNYGISPNISFRQIYLILKEIINPLLLLFNIKNIDFIIRLLISKIYSNKYLYHKLLSQSFFEGSDSYHITTLDTNITTLIFKIQDDLLLFNQGEKVHDYEIKSC